MTEDPRDKVARLVREHGVKKKPAKPLYFESGGDLNIQNSTVIIGGSHNQVRAQSAVNPPKPKQLAEMDNDERKAYDEGKWDGLERRTRDMDKEERAFRQRQKKRQKDRQNLLTYYCMMVLLLLAGSWFIIGTIFMSEKL